MRRCAGLLPRYAPWATAAVPGLLASAPDCRKRSRRLAAGPTCVDIGTSCEENAGWPTSSVHLGPHFHARARTLCEGGISKLQVISDFDQTLTRYVGTDGCRGDECHGILLERLDPDAVPGLRDSPWMHLKELEKLYTMGDKAGMEACWERLGLPSDWDERLRWWFTAYQSASVEFRLWEHVKPCIERSNTRTREGLAETFALLQAYGVPTLVVSAGLRQVLGAILEANACPLPACASVVTNDLREASVRIYDLNKRSALGHAPETHAAAIRGRSSVLVMGDKVSDLAVTQGLSEDCTVLSICFLSAGLRTGRDPLAEEIEEALKSFDVVLTKDASMHFVNSLLRSIAQNQVATQCGLPQFPCQK